MPPRKTAAQKREDRLEMGEMVIRVQATEETLSRLWALMMFADAPFKKEKIAQDPLPWEEPQTNKPPVELEVDYEAVRRAIGNVLIAYVEKFGKEKALDVIRSFGGETVKQVPQARLIDLHQALHIPETG